ncbi:hypothetical protein JTE90_008436 [Oedothorax gibbosus]|uniref:Uncharacterized protein n=1 Tax=Oedothorax gibbosus TaxID=931172 RepID=A0AAV6UVP8_9ARAC|nr:hypothetical protein JTE90_008436 [Oedothorax gibbosus]
MTWGNNVIKVVFRDEFYEEKYRSKFENFFKEILNPDEHFIVTSQVYDNTEQEYRKNQDSFVSVKLSKQQPKSSSSQKVCLVNRALEVEHMSRSSDTNLFSRTLEVANINRNSTVSHMDCPSKVADVTQYLNITQEGSDSKLSNGGIYPEVVNSDQSLQTELEGRGKKKSYKKMSEVEDETFNT